MNIDKFNYLESLLEDTALETISGLSLTNTNYERAISLLKERFDNLQILIASYMQVLATLSKVNSMKNITALRTLYNKIENSVASLKDCNVETDTYGNLLIGIIFERLPQELKVTISRSFKNNVWNLAQLLEVFKQELMVRETCSAVSVSGNQADTNDLVHTTKTFQINSSNNRTHEITCAFCEGKHSSSKCTNITEINQRKQILRQKERCFVCLRKKKES